MSFRKLLTASTMVLVTASLAAACSVPVFRYALEHWRPDAYVAVIFHDQPLTAEQQQLMEQLAPRSINTAAKANLVTELVDLSGDVPSEIRQLLPADSAHSLPWMVVRSPAKSGPSQTVFQGAVSGENVAAVLDSPSRATITKRLLDGQSVVWVFLECGRAEEDDAAFELLSNELKKLETELKLPEIAQEDLKDLSVAADALKIAFSAVRISRTDAAEASFVDMLLSTEPDLRDPEFVDQPMAFPIFGRGRALYALIGKGISKELVREASQFLTGACQCTVKAQNPGTDLIMNVNWDSLVITSEPSDKDLPPLAGFSGFGLPDDAASNAMPVESSAASSETSSTAAATASSTSGSQTESSQDSGDVAAADSVASEASVHNAATGDSAFAQAHEAHGDQHDSDQQPAIDDVLSNAIGGGTLMMVLALLVAVVLASVFFRPRV